MHSYTDYIDSIFLHCASLNESLNDLLERKHNHTDCIYTNFLHCVSSNVSSDCMLGGIHSHTGCICSIFPHCEFSNEPSIVCLVGCIVTLRQVPRLTSCGSGAGNLSKSHCTMAKL